MKYIKVKEDNSLSGKEVRNVFWRMIAFILKLFVPAANPDFDKKMGLVANWLLEFESDDATPDREIGLDADGHVILKMPFGRNFGYWVDNNVTYLDFVQSFEQCHAVVWQ